jgi:hypothetical protein
MADNFIRDLQTRWRLQGDEAPVVIARLKRGRVTPRLLLAFEVLQGVVGVVSGVAFLWVALDRSVADALFGAQIAARGLTPEQAAVWIGGVRALFGLSAAVMLLSVPPLAWAAVKARGLGVRWEDETPEGVLRAGARRADASLRANRVGRWHLWVLLAFVAALWALPALGLFPMRMTAVLAVAYILILGCVWVWLDLRRERLRRELETCLSLLAEYDAERGATPPK